ncbi:phosphatidylserine decarboxylase [Macrolepiota fuliginosa MF-IS2]|uniref:Phosphatidylserine decarboxylase proenzyme 1, mitochondrial n=1 Tax=Macrolepiota fuliginosa MF-IS2 TaxID=1400762 RepID=A0A9P5WYB0_9AGAR|nr:phosphatidylserine decarboxylase [Macrolepiota fuliginosa MF-IS2]
MYFSRKTLLTKGKKPLYAASRVLNASSASASSAFSRCWVHSTNKTSALIRTVKSQGFRRAYSTTKGSAESASSGAAGGGLPPGAGTPLYRKLISAWTETPTKWYPLPLAVGALLLVAIQYRRKSKRAAKEVELDENMEEVIKLKGPWQVHVLGALPLRNMSRLWGYVNSIELPIWFRPYGIKIYAYAFGCNLDEIEPSDLRSYASLGDFFYRRLKDGVRPVADAVLVSPADGRILHFGRVDVNGDGTGELGPVRVEQVKGITYSLDALLGVERPGSPDSIIVHFHNPETELVNHREFANVNGIEYSLDQLIGSTTPNGASTPPRPASPSSKPQKFGDQTDASVVEPNRDLDATLAHDTHVAQEMGVSVQPTHQRRLSTGGSVKSLRPGHSLFFTVIYLAPGDYHRFHSPTAWVVEKRRHFVGELFSVSPYIAKRLENLFVLNERVALLGRWKHGFFSMVPVGATNVGSIKINFDKDLRTNEKRARGEGLPPMGAYTEAVYSLASPILRGQPLEPAQEMGGFCLGSTIVLVFEAPSDFEFVVGAGEKVKVGQRLGDVVQRLEEERVLPELDGEGKVKKD